MAKKAKMVTVKDLAEEFGLDPAVIRRVLRASGLRAPEIPDNEGKFGPRAKYEWPEGSKELKQVRLILTEHVEALEESEEEEAEEAEDEEEEE